MPAQAVSPKDRAASLMPPVQSGMRWRVTSLEVLPEFRLKVQFLDGTEGVVEMAPLVHSPDAGVFAVLADPKRFAEACVELGAVTWPCGLDLAPDAMYANIKACGVHTAGCAADH